MLTKWLQHIEFAYPWAFSLLLLLPFIIYNYIKQFPKNKPAITTTTLHFIPTVHTFRKSRQHAAFFFRCLSFICLVVALARPRESFTQQETTGEGIDIMLCFDISGSMTEKDFEPNRLEAAKEVATQFVQNRIGDNIGIVVFSNVSFLLCPLTTHHTTVLNQIRHIQSGLLQEEGTAIGSGIATCVDHLRNSSVQSKIIILLTDGVDFGGAVSPDIARDMAKLYGIKIYSIGIGSEKEIVEAENTPLGTISNTRKLEFNEALLKDLAYSTGAQYFQATDKQALEKIYESINQLEKSKIQITSYTRYTEKYYPWLWAALIFLIIEIILRYTWSKSFP